MSRRPSPRARKKLRPRALFRPAVELFEDRRLPGSVLVASPGPGPDANYPPLQK